MQEFLPDVEVFLAADVLYDPVVIPSFVDFLEQALTDFESMETAEGGGGAPRRVVYIAATLRNPATYELFRTSLGEKSRLEVQEVGFDAGTEWVARFGAEALRPFIYEDGAVNLLEITAVATVAKSDGTIGDVSPSRTGTQHSIEGEETEVEVAEAGAGTTGECPPR